MARLPDARGLQAAHLQSRRQRSGEERQRHPHLRALSARQRSCAGQRRRHRHSRRQRCAFVIWTPSRPAASKSTWASSRSWLSTRRCESATEDLKVTCLSIGNPHCVVRFPRATEVDARRLGPKIEKHRLVSRTAPTCSSSMSWARPHPHSDLGARRRLHVRVRQQQLCQRERGAPSWARG